MGKIGTYEVWPSANGDADPAEWRVDLIGADADTIVSWHATEAEAEAECARLNRKAA
jgi:hypothetical protein